VDSGFDQNQTELGVLILAVAIQMLTDLDSLLDKHVQILWDLGGKSIGLKDADNLLSSDRLDLGNTIGIPEDDTNLRRGQTLLGELAHMLFHIGGRDFEPRRRRALVREGTLGDTLSGSMHTTHAANQDRKEYKGEIQRLRKSTKANCLSAAAMTSICCAEGSNSSRQARGRVESTDATHI
jgi:hypothetical protein